MNSHLYLLRRSKLFFSSCLLLVLFVTSLGIVRHNENHINKAGTSGVIGPDFEISGVDGRVLPGQNFNPKYFCSSEIKDLPGRDRVLNKTVFASGAQYLFFKKSSGEKAYTYAQILPEGILKNSPKIFQENQIDKVAASADLLHLPLLSFNQTRPPQQNLH